MSIECWEVGAGKTGGRVWTAGGLGFEARELGMILGTVAAPGVFEWQRGAPFSEFCPGR